MDSMAVHVPVTQEAIDEANEDLKPSKNLFRPGHGDYMLPLSMEQVLGLHLLTKEPDEDKDPRGPFMSEEKAIRAYEEARKDGEKWKRNDPIKVKNKITSIGRIQVNDVLPEDKEIDEQLDEDKVNSILSEIGREDGDTSADIANELRELGDDYCYQSGFSIGIEDLDIDREEKDEIFNKYEQKLDQLKSGESPFEVFSEAEEKVYEKIMDDNPDNALAQMHASGAKGNKDNIRQILGGPGLLTDSQGEVVKTPVTSSYAEGLDTGEFWTAMYGARKGMIDRAKSTAEPGAFTKELINNTLDWLITEKDCKTKQYIEKSPQNKAVKNRVLAESVRENGQTLAKKGDIVKPKLIKDFKKQQIDEIKVRTPLKCEAEEGLCSKCYGATEDGGLPSVGENVGIIAGHAMTEPSTQMTMNSFHSGGVASNEVEKAQGLDRLDQLLNMPKTLPNKATLAKTDGKVERINPTATGGKEVYIDGEKHFVPPNRNLKVDMRDFVQEGDPISEGTIKPQELLSTKNLDAVQKHLTDELFETYDGNIDEKTIETVVSKVTNLTQIKDSGDSDFTPGQYAPLNKVKSFNQQKDMKVEIDRAEGRTLAEATKHLNPGTKLGPQDVDNLKKQGVKKVKVRPEKIEHEVELKGINQLPLTKDDWLGKMNFNNIPKQFQESAATGAESKVKDTTDPISAFAYGKEFGDSEEGLY